MSTKNIILIGMPASGKSTAGVLLAKTVGYGFIDTDLLIQNEQKSLLCDIIAAKGAEEFIKIEETVLSDLWAERCVVATGGSAVYGERAMRHLKEIGTVVYLKLGEVADLYAERVPLYEKYADITVDCEGKDAEQTVRAIIEAVGLR